MLNRSKVTWEGLMPDSSLVCTRASHIVSVQQNACYTQCMAGNMHTHGHRQQRASNRQWARQHKHRQHARTMAHMCVVHGLGVGTSWARDLCVSTISACMGSVMWVDISTL
ncbi:hypothetical protein CFOL_v3_30333 [Cephalotus follicularis]|uniref:Uncharacterized protein n=1 Tax=Cephalotus follicularis TaxID=3775 RepID=A0A1Q3D334_CEPFO|nr:hypothetical protein CFOL_v3_30333 [Cephalotus follicularis]